MYHTLGSFYSGTYTIVMDYMLNLIYLVLWAFVARIIGMKVDIYCKKKYAQGIIRGRNIPQTSKHTLVTNNKLNYPGKI